MILQKVLIAGIHISVMVMLTGPHSIALASENVPFREPSGGVYHQIPNEEPEANALAEYQIIDGVSSLAGIWDGPWVSNSTLPFQARQSSATLWVRIPVHNSADHRERFVVHNPTDYTLNHMEFWLVGAKGTTSLGVTGADHPGRQRAWTSPMPATAFELDAGEKAWLVCDLRSTVKMQMQYHIRTERDFSLFNQLYVAFMFAYIGILLMITVSSGIFALSLRDRALGWYAIFCAGMSFVALLCYGLVDAYFEPVRILGGSGLGRALTALVVLPSTMFIASFLDSAKNAPRMHKIFMFNAYISLAIGFSRFYEPWLGFTLMAGDLILLESMFCFLGTGIALARRGVPFAKNFAVAYSFLVGSVLIWLFSVVGVIPRVWWTALLVPIGHVFELSLLTYAITVKFMMTEDERRSATRASGEAQKLNTLIRVLSHDLNNQLAIVLGYAKIGQQTAVKSPEKAKGFFEKILTAGEAQREIIDHVKVMRAIEDGKIAIELSSVGVKAILERVHETFDVRLKEKGVSLKFAQGEWSKVQVIADQASMLHQVLNNLISNSIKFSHPGSSIDITVTEEAGDLTHIAVRDYGVGMNEELLAKIFDTGEPTSHVGTAGEKGTGFGMPVVKSYMKLYGGDIKIKSWPETQYPENCGTEITLVFKSAPSDGERRAA